MTSDQLRDRLAARPFVPFTIRMADGREVDVSHPESIAYRGGRVAVVMNADESIEIVDLLLVPSLRLAANGGVEISPASPPGGS